MRIAMFTNNYKPYIGGVPVSIEHLAEALRERGNEVYVFAPSYDNEVEEAYVIRYPSFPITIAGAPIPNIVTKLFIRKVKELKIDVIHVHHPAIVGNVALEIKKKLGIPVVFTYHTRYEEYLHYIIGLEKVEKQTGMLERYLRFFCNRCDMLVAPTPGIEAYLQKKNLETSICVLPTGIMPDSFLPEQARAEQIRKQYLKDADYLFCTVSRLAKEKNLQFQIEGLACLKRILKKEGKTFRHMIIGDGPMKEELQERLQELGLSENVILLGSVDNAEIKNYQAAADMFLFTSKSETQGIVLLEAMAVANPVVAVDASGVRDVIKSGENGYLTEEESYQWARTVANVIGNKPLLAMMREGAKQTARAYREEVIAEGAERCYKEVCRRAMEQENSISIRQRYVV